MVAGARRAFDYFPLTLLGIAVVALSALVLWQVAFPTMDMVVLVAAYAGVALVALSVLLVVLLAVVLRMRRPRETGPAIRLETERPTPTGFGFPWLAWFPLIRVDPTWISPTGFDVTTRRKGFRRG